MRKSNAPLYEWMSSPIQYQVWPEAFDNLFALSRKAYLPETACHHYLSMAKSVAGQLKGKGKVKLKTYMYAVRPVLCCQWIIRHLEPPPMHIDHLLADIKDAQEFKDTVIRLISQKKGLAENDYVKRADVVEDYIGQKISEIEASIPQNPPKMDLGLFDEVFRSILNQQHL